MPCTNVKWSAFWPFEIGSKVVVVNSPYASKLTGEVVQVIGGGQFYQIRTPNSYMTVAHESLTLVQEETKVQIKKHWLVNKKVIVIHNDEWKGMEGYVRDVNEHSELALVALTAKSVLSGAIQSIPIAHLALDLSSNM